MFSFGKTPQLEPLKFDVKSKEWILWSWLESSSVLTWNGRPKLCILQKSLKKVVLPTMFEEIRPVSSGLIECILEFDTPSMLACLSGVDNPCYYWPIFWHRVNPEASIEDYFTVYALSGCMRTSQHSAIELSSQAIVFKLYYAMKDEKLKLCKVR